MQNKSITVTLVEFLTPLTLFITPLLFLPVFTNFFGTPKQLFIIAISLILLVGLTLDMLLHQTVPVSVSPLRLPLVLFGGAIITNLSLNPEGRTESIIGLGSLLIALSVLSFCLSLLPQSTKLVSRCITAIIASSVLLSIHGMLQLAVLYRLTMLPSFMQNKGFTPTGSPLITVSILTIASIVAFIKAKDQKSSLFKYLTFACSVLTLGTAMIHVYLLTTEGFISTTILPFSASWNITLDALKSAHNVFFGVGIANFSTLYTAAKPMFLNATPFWNVLPSSATTEIFQWITTMGLLGTATFFYLFAIGFKQMSISKSKFTPINVVFILSILTFFFSSGSVPMYLLFFVSLGLLTAQGNKPTEIPKNTSYILSLILLVAIGYCGYYLTQYVRAEYAMQKAQNALSEKDATNVYKYSLKAVQLVPTMTNYHISFSQVNLSLATNLLQKSDLTDIEKQQINQLVSLAISEGNTATTLRPHDARTWQYLANVYANLLSITKDADQMALNAYLQAIALDRSNPTLRTEFGSVLVQLATNSKDKEAQSAYVNRAVAEFQTAIQMKPDYPAAYYNLSKLLESVGEYENAARTMQKVVSLLKDTDPDLPRIKTELETIKSKVPKPTPTPKSALR